MCVGGEGVLSTELHDGVTWPGGALGKVQCSVFGSFLWAWAQAPPAASQEHSGEEGWRLGIWQVNIHLTPICREVPHPETLLWMDFQSSPGWPLFFFFSIEILTYNTLLVSGGQHNDLLFA